MIRVVEAYKGMWNLHKNVNANKDMQELVADVSSARLNHKPPLLNNPAHALAINIMM